MTLRAVLFDFDDTLCDVSISREERARRAYERVVAAGYTVNWRRFWHAINALDVDGFYRRGMEGVIRDLGLEETPLGRECIGLWAFRGAEDLIHVREGCIETLQVLSGRYRLGVITNGPEAGQRHKFEAAGLQDHFELFLTSGAAGVLKPDPAIFHQALSRMNLQPSEAVYIGDHLDLDVIGAQDAGMRAIWFDPGNRHRFRHIVPDATIRRLADLPAVLKTWA